MKKKLFLIFFSLCLIIFLNSCDIFNTIPDAVADDNIIDNNEIDDSKISINGTMPGNMVKNYTRRSITKDNEDLDTNYRIWLIPINYDNNYGISPSIFYNKKEFSINQDGSFAIDLPQDDDNNYVLLIMDLNQEEKKNQIIGYINIDGLLLIPQSDLVNDINLGTLELDDEYFNSETTLEEASTSFNNYNLNDLEIISEIDDTLRILKNHYINLESQIYLNTGYTFSTNTTNLIEDNLYHLNQNHYEINFGCPNYFENSNGVKLVKSDNSEEYDISSNYPNDSSVKYFTAFQDKDSIPCGYFSLQDCNCNEKGYYDLTYINIYDENDNYIIPIPHIKLLIENNVLQKIQMNWSLKGELIDGGIAKEFINENSVWLQGDSLEKSTYMVGDNRELKFSDDYNYIIPKEQINISNLNSVQFGYISNLGKIELVFSGSTICEENYSNSEENEDLEEYNNSFFLASYTLNSSKANLFENYNTNYDVSPIVYVFFIENLTEGLKLYNASANSSFVSSNFILFSEENNMYLFSVENSENIEEGIYKLMDDSEVYDEIDLKSYIKTDSDGVFTCVVPYIYLTVDEDDKVESINIKYKVGQRDATNDEISNFIDNCNFSFNFSGTKYNYPDQDSELNLSDDKMQFTFDRNNPTKPNYFSIQYGFDNNYYEIYYN